MVVALHELCDDCKIFCAKSQILNSRTVWHTISTRLANLKPSNSSSRAHTNERKEPRHGHIIDYFGSRKYYTFRNSDKKGMRRLIERHKRKLDPGTLVHPPHVRRRNERGVFYDSTSTGGSGNDETDEDERKPTKQLSLGKKPSRRKSLGTSASEISDSGSDSPKYSDADTNGGHTDSSDSDSSNRDLSESGASDEGDDEGSDSSSSPSEENEVSSRRSSVSTNGSLTSKRQPPRLDMEEMESYLDWDNSRETTFGKLVRSARSGCHLCNLLIPRPNLHFMAKELPQVHHQDARKIVSIVCGIASEIGHIFIWSAVSSENEIKRVLHVRREGFEDLPREDGEVFDMPMKFNLNQTSHPARDSESTSDDAMFSMIEDWIRKCQRDHSSCRLAATPSGKLPSRLLDLGQSPDRDYVHLRSSDRLSNALIEYAALSHCWGDADVTKLEEASWEAFNDGIQISSLPRMFQDSIKICRRLAIRYLWIDSLCIVNDDPEDWKREASTMADVYSNCVLNLGALHGSSSNASFFSKRDPRSYLPCKLPGEFQTYTEVYVPKSNEYEEVKKFQGMQFLLKKFIDHTEAEDPLLRRAWVLQERMLSPRTVLFGARNVYWECRTCSSNDICSDAEVDDFNCKGILDAIDCIWHGGGIRLPTIGPWRLTKKRSGKRKGKSREFENNDGGSNDPPPLASLNSLKNVGEDDRRLFQFSVVWSKLVELYSGKGMTFPRNKLDAMHGIVSLFHSKTGLEPFFGMWRKTIFDDLLWKRRGEADVEASGAAPTFSWASMVGPVTRLRDYCHDTTEQQCSIETMVRNESSSSSGSGYIEVKATLIDMWDAEISCHVSRTENNVVVDLKSPSQKRKRPDVHKIVITLDRKVQNLKRWYLMPMAYFECNDVEHTTHGLVLQQIRSYESNYIRVGAFEVTSPSKSIPWWKLEDENLGQLRVEKKELRIM